MDRMQGIIFSIIAAVLLAAVIFFLIDYGSEKSYATPQDVFDASRMALRRNDMRAWCQCITDDSRDFMAATMAVQEFANRDLMEKVGTEKKKNQIRAVEEIFKKHGLTEDFMKGLGEKMLVLSDPVASMREKLVVAREVIGPIGDRNGFVADMFDAGLKATGIDNPFFDKKDDKLMDVTVQGKVAFGIVESRSGDKEAKDMIHFRKQGEGWRIDLFPEPDRGILPPGHPR